MPRPSEVGCLTPTQVRRGRSARLKVSPWSAALARQMPARALGWRRRDRPRLWFAPGVIPGRGSLRRPKKELHLSTLRASIDIECLAIDEELAEVDGDCRRQSTEDIRTETRTLSARYAACASPGVGRQDLHSHRASIELDMADPPSRERCPYRPSVPAIMPKVSAIVRRSAGRTTDALEQPWAAFATQIHTRRATLPAGA
jgi:hypothetical protein